MMQAYKNLLRFNSILVAVALVILANCAHAQSEISQESVLHGYNLDAQPIAQRADDGQTMSQFSSRVAEQLWRIVVHQNNWDGQDMVSSSLSQELKNGGDFIPLKGNCYLVTFNGVYYICPDQNTMMRISPNYPPGGNGVTNFMSLPGGRRWALISGGRFTRGVFYSSTMAAIFTTTKLGYESVKVIPLSSTKKYNGFDMDSEKLCGAHEPNEVSDDASEIIGPIASTLVSIDAKKGKDGFYDIIELASLDQDCKTLKMTKRFERYVFNGMVFEKSR